MRLTGLTLRLTAVGALVLIPMAVTFWLLVSAGHDLRTATEKQREAQLQVTLATQTLRRAVDIETSLRGYAITRNGQTLVPLKQAIAVLPRLEAQLRQLQAIADPGARGRDVNALFSPVHAYVERFATPLVGKLRAGLSRPRVAQATLDGGRHIEAIRAQFAPFIVRANAMAGSSASQTETSAYRSRVIGTVGLISVPLLALLGGLFVSRLVTRPIKRVGAAADQIRGGDLTVRVEATGAGEVAHLGDSFNAMATSMQDAHEELAVQNAELEAQRTHLEDAVIEIEQAARMNEVLLEASNDGYIALDEQGITRAYTPQAAAIFGYPAEDVIGHVLADIVLRPEDRAAHHARRRAQLLDGERRPAYRVWTVHRDGRPRLVELTSAVVAVDDGTLTVYFVRDVTDSARRDEERAADEAVSRVLAESGAGDPLVLPIMSAMGTALGYRNGAFWEYDDHALVLRCTEIWAAPGFEHPEREAAVRALPIPTAGWESEGRAPVLDAWHTGRPQWTLREELTDPVKDALGETELLSGVVIPVGFAGERLGVLGFTTPETEAPDEPRWAALQAITALVGQVMGRHRAEREADRLKNEFFALLSHELRTPLTSVVGYLDLVRDEEAGELNDEQQHFLAIVERNAHRLMRLVGDLLFVAQIESGRLGLDLQRTDLGEVVQHGIEAAQPRADAGGVRLTLEAQDVTIAAGDEDRLGQLVDNLISNAIKFTPESGTVTVRLRREGDEALIEVRDTGPGIAPDDQKHLFERFFRTEEARRGAVPGLGLGLSICQVIAEGHGGALTVESTPGQGTMFRVRLPIGA